MHIFPRVKAIFAITVFLFSSLVLAESLPKQITLRDVINATLQHNPQLTGYQFKAKAFEGELQTAAMKPEYRVSADLENVAGTGEFSGIDASELTLALSSVIEMGGQRDARLGIVTASQQQLASEQRVLTLNVLAEVTHQFIALVAAQEQFTLQLESQQLAQENVQSFEGQMKAGRTPEAEFLRAKVALARAVINTQKAAQQVESERLKLSAFWAGPSPNFSQAQADFFALPAATSLPNLQESLNNNPDLVLLADDIQLREAELRQAKSERKVNLEWRAGFRQLQATDDSALVLGVSLPLGTSQRASGAIAKAAVNQKGAEHQREATRLQLQAQLVSLYETYQQALNEYKGLHDDVLPLVKAAMNSTTNAFTQGRYSYLELYSAQTELLDVQQALIDAAFRAHETRIDIERIIGSALSEKTSGETK